MQGVFCALPFYVRVSLMSFSPSQRSTIQVHLLDWFAHHQRPLPWRRSYSPYEVWISEMMLQQTQVSTMLPYFERWMQRFPSIKDVAEASEEAVLKQWEGLGYYSRARHIKQTAELLVQNNGGQFYTDFEQILSLPGIGRYSAGAISSIAFQAPYPAVDGNVIRVLSRLHNDAKTTRVNRERFWTMARSLLVPGKAREINQALMEFGALICTPKKPACARCPLKDHCKAIRAGTVLNLPNKGKPVFTVPIQVSVAVIRKKDKIFIQKRLNSGLMAGLWEFPGGRLEKKESPEAALHRELQEELNIQVQNLRPFMRLRHRYTKFRVDLHCFLADYHKGQIELKAASESRWVSPQELDRFPFPAANRRIVTALQKLV